MATKAPNIDVKVGMSLDELEKLSRQEKKQKIMEKGKLGSGKFIKVDPGKATKSRILPNKQGNPIGRPVNPARAGKPIIGNRMMNNKFKDGKSKSFAAKGKIGGKPALGMRSGSFKSNVERKNPNKRRDRTSGISLRDELYQKTASKSAPIAVLSQESSGSNFSGKKRKSSIRTVNNGATPEKRQRLGRAGEGFRQMQIVQNEVSAGQQARVRRSILDKSINAPSVISENQRKRKPRDYVVTIPNVPEKAGPSARIVQPTAVHNTATTSDGLFSRERKSILITKVPRRV